MTTPINVEEPLNTHQLWLTVGKYQVTEDYFNEKVSNFITNKLIEERQEAIYEIMRGQHGHDEATIVKSLQIDVDALRATLSNTVEGEK